MPWQLEGEILGYNKKMVVGIALFVLLFGIAFYVGAKYEKSKLTRLGLLKNKGEICVAPEKKVKITPTETLTEESFSGKIVAKTASSITLKQASGENVTIVLAPTTTFGKTETGKLADLMVGQQVTASATKSADGTVTIKNIQPAEAPAVKSMTPAAAPNRY